MSAPAPDCACYGRGQCAGCTLGRIAAGERRPDTEAQRAVDWLLGRPRGDA